MTDGPVYRSLTRALQWYAPRYLSRTGNTRTSTTLPDRRRGHDARARDDFIYTGNVWIMVVITHPVHGYAEGLHHIFITTQM